MVSIAHSIHELAFNIYCLPMLNVVETRFTCTNATNRERNAVLF